MGLQTMEVFESERGSACPIQNNWAMNDQGDRGDAGSGLPRQSPVEVECFRCLLASLIATRILVEKTCPPGED
jgi:hypothetical protein